MQIIWIQYWWYLVVDPFCFQDNIPLVFIAFICIVFCWNLIHSCSLPLTNLSEFGYNKTALFHPLLLNWKNIPQLQFSILLHIIFDIGDPWGFCILVIHLCLLWVIITDFLGRTLPRWVPLESQSYPSNWCSIMKEKLFWF